MGVISEKTYREFPMLFLTDIGLINHPIEMVAKFISTLKADLRKLFKSNILVTAIECKNNLTECSIHAT